MTDIDPCFGDSEEVGSIEDLDEVRLKDEDPARVMKVRINLETKVKKALIDFLRRKKCLFLVTQRHGGHLIEY